MASVEINGKVYGLRFDLYAMEQIEEEFGSIQETLKAIQTGKQFKVLRALFRIMANSYLSAQGEKEIVSGDEMKHCGLGDIKPISESIQNAIIDASTAETMNGNVADNQVHDMYLEEIERKNG